MFIKDANKPAADMYFVVLLVLDRWLKNCSMSSPDPAPAPSTYLPLQHTWKDIATFFIARTHLNDLFIKHSSHNYSMHYFSQHCYTKASQPGNIKSSSIISNRAIKQNKTKQKHTKNKNKNKTKQREQFTSLSVTHGRECGPPYYCLPLFLGNKFLLNAF